MKYEILSIEAWRYDDGWNWNSWQTLDFGLVEFADKDMTARKVLKWARDENLLSDRSKGKCCLENDGYQITINNRNTGEPLYSLCPIDD